MNMNMNNKIIFIIGCLMFFTVGSVAAQNQLPKDTEKTAIVFQDNIKFECKFDPPYAVDAKNLEQFDKELDSYLLNKPIDFIIKYFESKLIYEENINKIFVHKNTSMVPSSVSPKIVLRKFKIIDSKSDSRDTGYIIAQINYEKAWNFRAGLSGDTPVSTSANASFLMRIDYNETNNVFNGNITIYDAKNNDASVMFVMTAAQTILDFSVIGELSRRIEQSVSEHSIKIARRFEEYEKGKEKYKILNSRYSNGPITKTEEHIYNTSYEVAKSRMERNNNKGILVDSSYRMWKTDSETYMLSGGLFGERDTQADFVIIVKLYPESKGRVAVAYDAKIKNSFYDRDSKKEILGERHLNELLTKTTKAISGVLAEK